MSIPLEKLEQIDKQLAEECPMSMEKIDRSIDAVSSFLLLGAVKPEIAALIKEKVIDSTAKELSSAFMLRLLIAAKRGLTKKQAAQAAEEMLRNITAKGDEEPKGSTES